MKKIILSLAIASFGAVAFAQGATPTATPTSSDIAESYVINAKFAYEGKYVSMGQKHSNSNVQTSLDFEYFLPTQGGLDSLNIYGKFFYMSPITKQYNEASITIGTVGAFAEEYFFDIGYRFTGYPNSSGERQISAFEMNRAPLNRKNETYVGIGRDVQFFEGYDWSQVKLSAYGIYNWNQEQFTVEVAAEKTFKRVIVDELSINAKVAYGYACANNWTGDQDGFQPYDDYDYGYVALSADAIYALNETTSLSFGVRYAYNNGDDGVKSPNNDSSDFWCGAAITFRY